MVRLIATMVATAFTLAGCSAGKGDPATPDAEVATVEDQAVEEVPGTPGEADVLMVWAAEEFGEDGFAEMKYAAFDLNGDGNDELLAYFIGPTICGSGGCNLYVFEQDDGVLVERGRLTVTKLPVGVAEGNEQGWRDLVVTVGGGGIEGGLRNVPWTGEAYHSNPTVPPALPVDSMETELLSYD